MDGIPPVITGPGGTTGSTGNPVRVNTDCATSGTTVDFNEPTAIDNSGTVNLISRTHQPGQFFPVGTNPVTYRFADPSGNVATFQFDVIVTQGMLTKALGAKFGLTFFATSPRNSSQAKIIIPKML